MKFITDAVDVVVVIVSLCASHIQYSGRSEVGVSQASVPKECDRLTVIQ